ncbi:hypothetical protein [Streptomyces sp. NK15101]|uniref:hypothetical protein n=1 Tax=Streptomyces sp. NK15101 TaxID=2873261 RepID=UPI001CED9D1D|nr:hypothetical protein [Streptomyces sp. NK15101]
MSSNNEYGASDRAVSPDLAHFLIPDTPASLVTPSQPTEAAPAVPTTAELLAAWERHSAAALVPQPAAPAAPAEDPIVPRWVWRASAVTAAVSVMAGLIGFVVWGISLALTAAASAMAAAAPYVVGALVLAAVVAVACRRRPGADTLSVSVTQSVSIVQRNRK